MISEETLRTWRAIGLVDMPVVTYFLDSHIKAHEEITRLRTALKTMLDTLEAIDSKDFDNAIEGIERMKGLH